jgi:protoheme IX farnesyltransferase
MTMISGTTAALPGTGHPGTEHPAPLNAAHTRGRFQPGPLVVSYVALTKPRIIELLLVTTLPTMMLAERGLPPLALVAATLTGGAFAAGAANTINCYLDRDIDALMRRTSRRPLAVHQESRLVSPTQALAFGVLLAVCGTALLGFAVNWPAALLADAAILFYVFVYTLTLKRRTPSNIVVGGAAGCFPILVGWAAVTGRVTLPAVLLASVVFFWTPPHFWSLAMRFREDYAAAHVPMLPVVATSVVVGRKILFYSYATVAASLTLTPFAGWPYGACAALLGAWLLIEAHTLYAQIQIDKRARPMRLFRASISYLTLLFGAVAFSALL